MAQQQVFDLFSGDLLAAAVDLIFFPALDGDIPVFIDRNQIAGAVKPSASKASALCCGLL
jgi:hypothetical protein